MREVLVVKKQLMLVEEVRISKREVTEVEEVREKTRHVRLQLEDATTYGVEGVPGGEAVFGGVSTSEHNASASASAG
jgi:hypothetical protein